MNRPKMMIVDDELEILQLLEKFLEDEGFEVFCAQDGRSALELIQDKRIDVVVTDIRMPGMDGLELLRRIKRFDDLIEVIVLTGYASIEAAVNSMKNDGAFDFLTKPIENFEDLLISVEKALSHRHLRIENVKLLEALHRNQSRLESKNKSLHRTRQRLDYLRRRYEDLYEHAPVGYVTVDRNGMIQEVNQTAVRLMGRSKEKMKGMNFGDFIAPQGHHEYQKCRAALQESLHHLCELPIRRTDGSVLYANVDVMAILGADGQPEQIRVALSDRTEQKKTEDALKESELRYRSFVENFKGIAFRLHPEGRPIFYHGAVKELTGYDETQLLDPTNGWESLIHPEEMFRSVSQRNSLGQCGEQSLTQEYRIRHADGQWRWVREHIQNICDDSDRPVVLQGIVFDITEHKALQARSFQSRKLEAIATLAGGVAHQFNNALAGLVGNIELLEMELEPDETIGYHIKNMLELSGRMSTLTRQLLAYARGGKYNPCDVELGQLIKGSLELIRHRLPPEIELEVDLAARQDLVSVDTAQLQMVLLALYDNAVEALEKGGRLRISTRETCFSVEDIVDYPNRRPGPYVCLTVQDNGCGMGKETQSKIFDPFFTTKFIGRGLGLSAAYGIIANHNGWIAASSVRGEGTEIRVYLPLLAAKETAPSAESLLQSAVIGDATLLVVEDEPLVMDAVCTMLEKMKYRVLKAETGRGALEILRTRNMPLDLVLLDVGLPDLEADVVYRELHKIQPGIRVVVWSGYDNRGPVEDLLDAGADGFLQKPFSKARLIEKVLSVLGHQREAAEGPDEPKQGSKYLRVV